MADQLRIVPFVPVRCPHCDAPKPTTTGRKGRKRYHSCQGCKRKFLSWELGADSVRWAQTTGTPDAVPVAAPQPSRDPVAASQQHRRPRPADRMPLL